ncbi:membrane dipeptidase [candidate division WOR-3 bacterium]|nr:membrane dipeptidase [candidate division WOR-3 bacterium]
MVNDPFCDIHCHSTVIPFNKKKSIWYSRPPTKRQERKGRFLWDNIGRPYTQSDFVSLARGALKVVSVSLYPIEWGLMTIVRKPILNQGFFKAIWEIISCTFRVIIQFLAMYTFLGRILTTYPTKRIRQILKRDREYFDDLVAEYALLKTEPDCPVKYVNKYGLPADTRKEIVSNYTELRSVLDDPGKKHTIAVIGSIEGSHVFGGGQKNSLEGLPDSELNNLSNPKTQALVAKISQNIAKLKTWDHVPLFMGLCHHFWNQLAGHAMSQADGGHVLFDQRRGMNTGITEVGKTVVKNLLSTSNGRRILVDAKHMSIDTRKWFYGKIEQHNAGKPDEKKVPVIVSHAGLNGIGAFDASRNSDDHDQEDTRYRLSDSVFNVWDINPSNEEITKVYDSNGLIGIILDQRILGGQMVNDFLNDLPPKLRKEAPLFHDMWVKPFLSNILHVARTVDNYTHGSIPAGKTIWDNIVSGCDYDGRINPIDSFCSGVDIPALKTALDSRMKKMRDEGTEPLLSGKTDAEISDIIHKITFGNLERFLGMYFTDSYLADPLYIDVVF